MSRFVESLKRLFNNNKITSEKINSLLLNNEITKEEAEYIRG